MELKRAKTQRSSARILQDEQSALRVCFSFTASKRMRVLIDTRSA